jgi:hypothetical protein
MEVKSKHEEAITTRYLYPDFLEGAICLIGEKDWKR